MKNRFCTMAYMIFRRKYSNEKKIYCKNLQEKTHKGKEMTKYIPNESKIVKTTEESRITAEIENVTQPCLRMEDMDTAVCMADHFEEPDINLNGELILSLSEVIKSFEKEFPGLVHMQEPACKSAAPGKLTGAYMVLEKSRLSYQQPLERYYRAFCNLMPAQNPDMKEKCLLSNDIFDHWCVSQGLQTAPSIVAEEALIFANEAFDVLGFTQDEKYNIFKNTAAMMHMGNFTDDFVPVALLVTHPHNVLHIDSDGQGVIESLKETYAEGGYVSTSAVERENAQKVEEKPCLIALDLEQEMSIGSFRNLICTTKLMLYPTLMVNGLAFTPRWPYSRMMCLWDTVWL